MSAETNILLQVVTLELPPFEGCLGGSGVCYGASLLAPNVLVASLNHWIFESRQIEALQLVLESKYDRQTALATQSSPLMYELIRMLLPPDSCMAIPVSSKDSHRRRFDWLEPHLCTAEYRRRALVRLTVLSMHQPCAPVGESRT